MRAAWVLLTAVLSGCSDEPGEPLAEPAASAEKKSGQQLYADRCAQCHDGNATDRAPPKTVLAQLDVARLVFAMANGKMKEQSDGLTLGEQVRIAEYLGQDRKPYAPEPEDFCASRNVSLEPRLSRWGADQRNSGQHPAGVSLLTSDNVAALEPKWTFGLPGATDARSQIVVTDGSLFVGTVSGHLFALDRLAGCIQWHATIPAAPRTALALGSIRRGGPAVTTLFFGDVEAHVNAIDARNGEVIWRRPVKVHENSMLTGSPVPAGHLLIVPVSSIEVALAQDPTFECCRAHGALVALDAGDGSMVWEFHTTREATKQGENAIGTPTWGPSGAAIWSTPTIDEKRGLVYVGTGQNTSRPATDTSDAVLAIDLGSGELRWKFQAMVGDVFNNACTSMPKTANCPRNSGPDFDIGAGVILTQTSTGADVLLVGQKSGDLYALDPENDGDLIWRRRAGAGSVLGGIHWGMAIDGDRVFAPVADPEYPLPGYLPKPGIYAFSIDDGEPLWSFAADRGCETSLRRYFGRTELHPECSFYYGFSAAVSVVNDVLMAGALDGRVFAFSTATGDVLWSYDTHRSFEALGAVETHGGSIDVQAPFSVGDMLYVQSGYGLFGQLPGNALVAFSIGRGLQ